jgi:hypothetical protein
MLDRPTIESLRKRSLAATAPGIAEVAKKFIG